MHPGALNSQENTAKQHRHGLQGPTPPPQSSCQLPKLTNPEANDTQEKAKKKKAKVLKGKITEFHSVHSGSVFNILCGELGLLLSLRLSGIIYLNPHAANWKYIFPSEDS